MSSNPPFLFFDHASTTPCSQEAADKVLQFATEEFGNPSSSHRMGQNAARAIREAKLFFADLFKVTPEQVIFTGSGSESDNLAIYGSTMPYIENKRASEIEVLYSAIEHPAVAETIRSLEPFGVATRVVPIKSSGVVDEAALEKLISPRTALVSIMSVNNIVGSVQPVEKLAKLIKSKKPDTVFHTDAVQAFSKVELPRAPSSVDLLSISGHKIEGPKGVGALIVLNKNLIERHKLRPMIWGGGQEEGYRSGTQNAGLIAGFHVAAKNSLEERSSHYQKTLKLSNSFRESLEKKKLLDTKGGPLHWNSPEGAVPHIVSLSVPGVPVAPLVKVLEEHQCIVATGSACSSKKAKPDHVLAAMGCRDELCNSTLRVSFSHRNSPSEINSLVSALGESIERIQNIMKG